MWGYLDTSDAEIKALTRRRRAILSRLRVWRRLRHERLSFPVIDRPSVDALEASWRDKRPQFSPWLVWRNAQWARGNRSCGYCGVRMTRQPNLPRTCTVDHRHPRAFGGKDEEANWIMACLRCNNLKGTMSERAFRDLLNGVRLTA